MGLWNNHLSFILSALCKDADVLLTSPSSTAYKAQKTVSLDIKTFFLNCTSTLEYSIMLEWLELFLSTCIN